MYPDEARCKLRRLDRSQRVPPGRSADHVFERPLMKRAILVTLFSSVFSACTCGAPIEVSCTSDSDCGQGQICDNGMCTGGAGGGAGTGGGKGTGGGNGTGGGGGGSTIFTGCDQTAADNSSRDTDCDGISDLEEYNTLYANNNRTDPCNSDSDGDGIRDGVEMG